MKAIIKRELKNFLKNPVFWAGLIIMLVGIYQILQPYLKLHYFESDQEFQGLQVKSQDDADVMYGYIPLTEEEQKEKAYEQIRLTLVEEMMVPKEKADKAIEKIRDMTTEEACNYLEREHRYYNAKYDLDNKYYEQMSVKGVNTYIKDNLQAHSYSYYFSRKFADFAGLFMAFFATIVLAFLFLKDTRKDMYELLHTKPLSARQYILGKVGGGYAALFIALAVLTVFFAVVCTVHGYSEGFSVNPLDLVVAAVIYIMPNMLMIVCVYAIIALIFKNPLPAVPLLFLYIIGYSNMGATGSNGQYGYIGRLLSITVRFPGKFFETDMPPMVVLNQTFLILASIIIIVVAIRVWNRRRVY